MAYLDSPRFPTNIAYGLKGGPGRDVKIWTSQSGAEVRHSRRSRSLRRYDAKYGVRNIDDLYTLRNFFEAIGGPLTVFRFKDFFDFTTAANGIDAPTALDQELGTGDGSTTTFQLRKTYSSGVAASVRPITKPVSGTTLIALNGTPTSSFTVDLTNGQVTLTGGAPAGGVVVSGGCEYDVPVRFDDLPDGVLYQSYDYFKSGSVPAIPLVEVLEEIAVPLDFTPGQAVERSLTSDITMALSVAAVYVVSAPGSGRSVLCPSPSSPYALPTGRYFTVLNVGANSVTVKNHSAATLATLAQNQGVDVYLGEDNSGAKYWYTL